MAHTTCNQPCLTSFPVLGDSHSPLSVKASKPSASVKSTPTPPQCSKNTGQMCQTMEISEPSETCEPTLLQEDSLASHSVLPGSEKARQMTVSSGLRCAALLRNQGPIGCLLRTFLESSEWNSTACFLTWKTSATPHGRLLFQLAPSVPTTSEIGFSLLPTPGANDWKTSKKEGQRRGQLNEAVENTPTWIPCPCCENFYCTIHQKHSHECECPPIEEMDFDPYTRPPLGYNLNPVFVEWLMGYPLEWTALNAQEMQSFRKSRKSLRKPSGNSTHENI